MMQKSRDVPYFFVVVIVLEDAIQVYKALQSLRITAHADGDDHVCNAQVGFGGIVMDTLKVDDVRESQRSTCRKLSTCVEILDCHRVSDGVR